MISEQKLGAVAGELTWRLHQRNSTIQPRHDFPKLLVSTSSEALRVANDVEDPIEERDAFNDVGRASGEVLVAVFTLRRNSLHFICVARCGSCVETLACLL